MKKFLAIFLTAIMLIALCGCSDNSESAIIYYGVTSRPRSIDPQTAQSVTELMLVRNLYEGLLREDTDGSIKNGIANSHSKSGLTYTFSLNKDAVWSDGTPITADDFVFGIQRALTPKTQSPNAQLLYAIKNAAKVHNGKANVSTLGIKATDKHTLQITLECEDKDFLYALTTAPAMPCNKKFFEAAVGKYGMSFDTTLSNGSYILKKWNTEDFAMRIAANKDYKGSFVPKNSAVYFSYTKDKTAYENLNKSSVDIAEITDNELNSAVKNGFSTKTMKNKALVLSIGNGYTKNMKSALHQSMLKSDDFNDINASHAFANKLLPDMFAEYKPAEINIYNPLKAKLIYNAEIDGLENKKFPQTTVYYYGDNEVAKILKKMAGHWQENLGAYLNITPLDSDLSVAYKVSNDMYNIGAYSFEFNEKNLDYYLTQLNITAGKSFDKGYSEDIYKYSDIIPIAYYGTVFAYDDCLSNVHFFDTNGFIDFSKISKKQ